MEVNKRAAQAGLPREMSASFGPPGPAVTALEQIAAGGFVSASEPVNIARNAVARIKPLNLAEEPPDPL